MSVLLQPVKISLLPESLLMDAKHEPVLIPSPLCVDSIPKEPKRDEKLRDHSKKTRNNEAKHVNFLELYLSYSEHIENFKNSFLLQSDKTKENSEKYI